MKTITVNTILKDVKTEKYTAEWIASMVRDTIAQGGIDNLSEIYPECLAYAAEASDADPWVDRIALAKEACAIVCS